MIKKTFAYIHNVCLVSDKADRDSEGGQREPGADL